MGTRYLDPVLRPSFERFNFQDFPLAQTLEEFEQILGVYLKNHSPFMSLGETKYLR